MNRPSKPSSKKLLYTYSVLVSNEELAELEDLMLQNDSDSGPIDVEVGENLDQDVEDVEE